MPITRIGRYDVHGVLGAGGFATVYRATDPRLDAQVAIKVLAENWSIDPDIRRRFRTEAVLLRRLQSQGSIPGLIEVHDIDETDDGRPFFVMGFADLGTLHQRAGRQRWSIDDVRPVIDALKVAVTAIHDTGVVHRDLKPSNLMIRTDRGVVRDHQGGLLKTGERLVVGDLGLAKDLTVDATALSVAGGTARYSAPEQLDPARTVDHRADIYAATVLVGDLLRGEALDELEPPIIAALDKGYAEQPDDRYDSMGEWRDALLASFDVPPTPTTVIEPVGTVGVIEAPQRPAPPAPATAASPPPLPSPASSSVRSKTPILAVAAVVVLAILGLLGSRLLGGTSIIGPDSIVVGESVRYRADAPSGSEVVWTDWTGATIAQQDLQVQARLPGTLSFSLSIDGGSAESKTITVVESASGPTIVGSAEIPLGETTQFFADISETDVSHFWINGSGDRIDTTSLFVTPSGPESISISLVSIGADGIERGTRRTIDVGS